MVWSAALAKRKDSIALFEVVSKGKASKVRPDMSVPGWMKSEGPEPGPAAEPASPSPKEQADAPKLSGRWRAGEWLLVSISGSRLRLSLSYMSCTVAVGGMVVLLSLAFWLGRASARYIRQAPASDAGPSVKVPPPQGPGAAVQPKVVEAKRPAPEAARVAAPEVVRPAPEAKRVESPAAEDRPVNRVPGKWYMVIQDLQGAGPQHEAEAARIVGFLKESNEPAEVKELGGRVIVWSLKAFDGTDGQDVQDYAKRIEELGKRYFQMHQTHMFKQSRRDGKLDPWMVQEPK